jgi:O-antigen ligase
MISTMHLKIDRHSIQNYCLYAYFFSINIENFNPTGYFSVSRFAALLYLFSILPSIKYYLYLSKNSLKFFWPIVAFFIYLTLVSLANINNFSSRFFDFAIFQNLLIFIIIVNHARRDSIVLDRGMLSFAIGSIFTILLIILGIGVGMSDEGARAGRLLFFNAGPNELGIKLATGAVIILVMVFQNNLKLSSYRYLMLIFVPIILYTVLQTGSRSAFLVPIVSILMLIFFRVLLSKYKILAFIGASAAIVIIAIPLFYIAMQAEALNNVIQRFALTGGAGDFSETGRFTLWIGFFLLIREKFIFGNGLSGFDLITYQYFGFLESPHNVFLEVFLYTGIIGFILYLIFIYRALYASYVILKINNNILPVVLFPTMFAYIFILQGLSEKIAWLILAYIFGKFLFGCKHNFENKN